jgi:hypothetical protein
MCFKKLRNYFKRKSPPGNVDHIEQKGNDVQHDDPADAEPMNPNTNIMNSNTDKQQEESAAKKELPEFVYLEKLIRHRLNTEFPSSKDEEDDSKEPEFPALNTWKLPWIDFAKKNELENKQEELTLLLIGITPHVRPDLFDRVIKHKIKDAEDFPVFGGVRGRNCRFFLPTGETALYLIAGENFNRRLEVQQLFGAEHLFWQKKMIWLEDMQHGEPSMHGRLVISPDYVDLLTYGVHTSPQFSISFPAKKIAPDKTENPATFEQLVISKELLGQIEELKNWLKYNDPLVKEFGLSNKFRQGYRTLFYGPPGTGKTFTAQILGNDLQKEVYKIDLSMIVSKYIGETEKNLELLFARAEDKGWILFFDEADALFGKRTNVRDAHDKYANQEVSYLLQRIENYNGLVILATNMKNNIDDAFIRRFNSILKFPLPNSDDRKQIWEKLFPENKSFVDRSGATAPDEVILELIKNYELTGGNINNIVHYACLKAYERKIENPYQPECEERKGLVIYLEDILNGIKKELIKEGKPFTV